MRRRDRRGFTLIELLVVVVVVSVGTTVAALSVGGGLGRSTDGDVDTARSRAIMSGEAEIVAPDPSRPGERVLLLSDGRVVGERSPPDSASRETEP